MRRRLDELRQVRKEAAVIARVVCCGVPGLFRIYFTNRFLIIVNCEWVSLAPRWEGEQIEDLI
jgi:hypothetical protein